METKILKHIVHCVIALSLLVLSVVGCTGTANKPDTSKPPQIPPESSFVMDFSDFTSSTGASHSGDTAQLASFIIPGAIPRSDTNNALGDRSNFGYATVNVGFWNIVVFVGLAVPVASFIESFNHTPVQQEDSSWVWTYDVPVAGDVYTAELHGKYIKNGVRWEMYISKQGEYSDFLWYYGESDLSVTEGYWILKNNPSDPTDLIRIDWHRNLVNKTGDIKYTNIVPGGPENGGFISYETTVSKSYDCSYEIFNKGKNEKTYIEWNSLTLEGRVKNALHFGDDDWRCWNSQLVNTTCP
ncbi:MAG TPA: hypothetical protein VGA85_04325 [Dehalococcoidales bacterium]